MRLLVFIALLGLQGCQNRSSTVPNQSPSNGKLSDTVIFDLPYETGEIVDTIIDIKN